MRSRSAQRGFTLIELLVVIAIIAILASILFPVFGRAREKARQTQCTSNLMQMGKALQIYVNDNKSNYPGSNWVAAMGGLSAKVMQCPSEQLKQATDIHYGFNGLLLNAAGTGINESQIMAATEVGAFADCTEGGTATQGGIIGGGGFAGDNLTVQLNPRHEGVIVAFCDGHAKYFPGKEVKKNNASDPLCRAFYSAAGVGILRNYGGGFAAAPAAADGFTSMTTPVAVTGEFAGKPLVMALGDVYSKASNTTTPTTLFKDNGFPGATLGATGVQGAIGDKLVVTLDKTDAAAEITTPPTGGGMALIGKTVIVPIVAKNSTLQAGALAGYEAPVTSGTVKRGNITLAAIKAAMEAGTNAGYHAYTYDTTSRTRQLVYGAAAVDPAADLGLANIAADDYEMVDKVSQDPIGIGYVNAAFADPNKVQVLGLEGKFFPQAQATAASANWWIFPATAPTTTAYPLVFDVKVLSTGTNSNIVTTDLAKPTVQAYFGNCPLYKASFFKAW